MRTLRARTEVFKNANMQFTTKVLTGAILVWLGTTASYANPYNRNGWPCVNELCVGDGVVDLARVKWERIKPPEYSKTKMFRDTEIATAEAVSRLHLQDVRAPVAAMKVMRNYAMASMRFDAGALSALPDVRACGPLSMRGRFYTDSGLRTEVTIQLVPTPDGKQQDWRVVEILRYWPSDLGTDQKAELESLLSRAYADFLNRRVTTPTAVNVLGSYLTLEWSGYHLSGQGLASIANRNQHLKLPGCITKAVTID